MSSAGRCFRTKKCVKMRERRRKRRERCAVRAKIPLNRKIYDVLVAVAVVKTTAKATPKTNDLIGSMKKNNRAALAARSLV